MLAAATRCFSTQPQTNHQGVSEHLRTQIAAAELFDLRHQRSCASSASGKRSTCSGATPSLCTSCLLVVMGCTMSLAKVVMQDILLALDFAIQVIEFVMSICTAVFESMVSPLEMCACIVVVDINETKNCFQICLSVISLLLAVCDWHVPCVFFRPQLSL